MHVKTADLTCYDAGNKFLKTLLNVSYLFSISYLSDLLPDVVYLVDEMKLHESAEQACCELLLSSYRADIVPVHQFKIQIMLLKNLYSNS